MPHYTLSFADPAGHLLDVSMTIDAPEAAQRVAMPSWIPGSYLMREFARHVLTLAATQSGQPVVASKIDKSTWRMDCTGGAPLVLHYRVYAWDRSVRGCYFDLSRGFVNPAAALLQAVSASGSDAACTLQLLPPAFAAGASWHCATAMTSQQIDSRGFGSYRAESYDELIDHPIECADFDEFSFDAGGVPHRFVVSGQHRGDLERLRVDSQKICQGHCDLFGDTPPPFASYLFLLHVVDDGHGGLEHRASTALVSPRSDLPVAGDPAISEGYCDLLGLISHEYFHVWNVKRIKPAAFLPYDTSRENYTRLLWLFEGFTSYYDDLMLKRVGLITDADYLKILGRRLTQLLRAPGRRVQSAAEASFDAWIKYYRADENAPNSQFSYYLRGSFIALALDLMQRARSAEASTLDDVMRGLWREFGDGVRGVEENPQALFERLTDLDLADFFRRFVDGHEDPEWATLFTPLGIAFRTRPAVSASDRGGNNAPATGVNLRTLGVQVIDAGGNLPTVKHVFAQSAAWQAGLSAGDTLVAIDGLRAGAATLGKHLARFKAGEALALSWFRHDVLQHNTLSVPAAVDDTAWLEVISISADGDGAIADRRKRWLSG